MILLGTSGYSFDDWVGPFYPSGLRKGSFLDYYARRFPTVEVNSTYYRIPHPSVLYQMERKTPEGFVFMVKLNGEMTHKLSRDLPLYESFHAILGPLIDAGKFGGVLAQFPWSFKDTATNREFLEFLRERFPDAPVFVEFRHDSWMNESMVDLLGRLGLGYVSVDEPRLPGLLPPVAHATTETGYVRFHGRNTKDWWGGNDKLRYDYLYNEEELRGWLDRIRDLESKTAKTFVFFNNCHAGRAIQGARLMERLLGLDFAGPAERQGSLL
jgi:uncharacterized protein YecE (DUF72 family)